MTQSRKTLVSLDATPYYHCTTRCVRRAFLCGKDKVTGRNFSHRKQWFEDRLLQLQSVFAVDIAAYAIMSNHYHVVVFIDEVSAKSWTLDEVIDRWCILFKGPHYIQKYRAGERLSKTEIESVETTAMLWRQRLMDLSWFIRCVNEHIARLANKEDNCTGRFWEGRFKSQALLDEKAILACMAYVDLNPVRAKMAKSPEFSANTSVEKRIVLARATKRPNRQDQQPKNLLPFVGNERLNIPKGIQFHLTDYLELVDWTGQQIRPNKRGVIDQQIPPILDRLGIERENWITLTTKFEAKFRYFAGAKAAFDQARCVFKRIRMQGLGAGQTLFGLV